MTQTAGASAANILLYEPELNQFVIQESSGGDPLVCQIKAQDSVIVFLRQQRGYLLKSALANDPKFIDIRTAGLRLMTGVGAEVVFPMWAEEKLIGLMNVGSREGNQSYSEPLLELLSTMVSMASLSVNNALLYQELSRQNAQLAEITKLKQQFTSNITHELRTPLHGILGLTSILLEQSLGELNGDQKRYLEMIQASGQNLLEVVDKILDLTKFQAGTQKLIVKPIDVQKIISDIHQNLKPTLKEERVNFQIQLGEVNKVYGDEEQVSLVFFNLLENAAKFTLQGKITIMASRIGDMAQFCISDSGIGMDEHEQQFIFESFRQANGELNRAYEGTGLGLTIAKKIVELHGGRIWVESKKGYGSNFYFTLPQNPSLVQM